MAGKAVTLAIAYRNYKSGDGYAGCHPSKRTRLRRAWAHRGFPPVIGLRSRLESLLGPEGRSPEFSAGGVETFGAGAAMGREIGGP
jgi:hypothetical protein